MINTGQLKVSILLILTMTVRSMWSQDSLNISFEHQTIENQNSLAQFKNKRDSLLKEIENHAIKKEYDGFIASKSKQSVNDLIQEKNETILSLNNNISANAKKITEYKNSIAQKEQDSKKYEQIRQKRNSLIHTKKKNLEGSYVNAVRLSNSGEWINSTEKIKLLQDELINNPDILKLLNLSFSIDSVKHLRDQNQEKYWDDKNIKLSKLLVYTRKDTISEYDEFYRKRIENLQQAIKFMDEVIKISFDDSKNYISTYMEKRELCLYLIDSYYLFLGTLSYEAKRISNVYENLKRIQNIELQTEADVQIKLTSCIYDKITITNSWKLRKKSMQQIKQESIPYPGLHKDMILFPQKEDDKYPKCDDK